MRDQTERRETMWNLHDLAQTRFMLREIARRFSTPPTILLWSPHETVQFEVERGIWLIDHGKVNSRIHCRACAHRPALRYEFVVEDADGKLHGPVGSTCLFVHALGEFEAHRIGTQIVDAFHRAEQEHNERHARAMRSSRSPEDYFGVFGLRTAAQYVRDHPQVMHGRLLRAVEGVATRSLLPMHAYHALLALRRQLELWDHPPTPVHAPAHAPVTATVSRQAVLRAPPVAGPGGARPAPSADKGLLERLREAARAAGAEARVDTSHLRPSTYMPGQMDVTRPGKTQSRRPGTRARRGEQQRGPKGLQRQAGQERQRREREREEQRQREQVAREAARRQQQAREAALRAEARVVQLQVEPDPVSTVDERQPVVLLASTDPWLAYLRAHGLPDQCPGMPGHPDLRFRQRVQRHYREKRQLERGDVLSLRALLKG